MRSTPILVAAFIALLALPALAQNPPAGPPTRVRGTVEKLDGQSLTVKSRDGQSLTVTLAPNFAVSAVVPKSLADIKPGDYVASTSVKGADGTLKAIEVQIFPENMRGTAEGQFPWDLVPDSVMTNATVAQITSAPQGKRMKVTYKGGEAEVTVPAGIPIVGYVPADASLLKPGAAVFIVARKQADGTLTAARVTAEKAGVKPPM
jgi:glucose/arabinose dehydrogenase